MIAINLLLAKNYYSSIGSDIAPIWALIDDAASMVEDVSFAFEGDQIQLVEMQGGRKKTDFLGRGTISGKRIIAWENWFEDPNGQNRIVSSYERNGAYRESHSYNGKPFSYRFEPKAMGAFHAANDPRTWIYLWPLQWLSAFKDSARRVYEDRGTVNVDGIECRLLATDKKKFDGDEMRFYLCPTKGWNCVRFELWSFKGRLKSHATDYRFLESKMEHGRIIVVPTFAIVEQISNPDGGDDGIVHKTQVPSAYLRNEYRLVLSSLKLNKGLRADAASTQFLDKNVPITSLISGSRIFFKDLPDRNVPTPATATKRSEPNAEIAEIEEEVISVAPQSEQNHNWTYIIGAVGLLMIVVGLFLRRKLA